MFKSKMISLAGLCAALALGACASVAAPGMTSNDGPSYVASVEVNQLDTSAPPTFAAALREAVMDEAAFYGHIGRPISLRIDIDRVHFKDAVQALIIGDDNKAEGRVSVIDLSGARIGEFAVQVNAEESGISGADVGLTVLGALDPTGVVGIATMAGDAASAAIDRSGTAAAMRSNFALETLRQTYGDDKAKAVNSTRQEQKRARAKADAAAP